MYVYGISCAMISFATCSANNSSWSALRVGDFAVCGFLVARMDPVRVSFARKVGNAGTFVYRTAVCLHAFCALINASLRGT